MARQRGNTKTKFKPGHSADVIKMPYLVVCAVRLASLDSTWPCLPVLSEECQRIKFPTRMDPVVPITLKNAFVSYYQPDRPLKLTSRFRTSQECTQRAPSAI